MSRPYRVMTVCTGNICRSPMAQVVLTEAFARAGLGDDVVVVDSTGISDEEDGNPMDRRAAAVLSAAGYSPAQHTARQADAAMIGGRDLVLAMTSRHARWLRTTAPDPEAVERIRMYRSFDPEAPAVNGPGAVTEESGLDLSALDIADPWYGDRADFEVTLAQVEAAAAGIVDHVRAALAASR